MSVVSLIKDSHFESDSIPENNTLINVRLHPCLDEKLALKQILSFNDIPSNLKLQFISNKDESIIESIKKVHTVFWSFYIY